MPDAPLSRRARRTFEEEAADRAALEGSSPEFAQGLSSGEVKAIEDERAALSRRDRRRMERLNHPLEAWTAEEEMLATGQIPAMTPERIAEQERISRHKAERAAEEATAASQEFRRLAASDFRRAPEPVVEQPVFRQPPPQAQAYTEPISPAPFSLAPVAPVPVAPVPAAPEPAAPAPVAPVPVLHEPAPYEAVVQPQWQEPATDSPDDFEFATEPTWPPSPEQVFVEQDAVEAPAFDAPMVDTHETNAYGTGPVLEPYQPVMALDDEPLPVVHHLHDVIPVEADSRAVDSRSADEPVTQRSDVIDALFPPGSSQTALRQLDPFATAFTTESAPAESGQIPTLLPPQEVPEREVNPIDEIRRLTAEAMGGIERASKADEAAAAAAAAAVAASSPPVGAKFDSLPSTSASPAEAKGPVDSFGDWAQSAQPAPAASAGGAAPRPTGFDQVTLPPAGPAYGAAPASGQFPMPGQPGQQGQQGQYGQQPQSQPASGQFPMPGQQGLAGPLGPAWNSQPLTEPGHAAEAQAFTPLSNVPKPDFSGLYQQGSPSAFPPLTGAINTAALNSAEFHGGDMSASGQTPGIRRPDLPEVGGIKHFKWLHLSVIGALMFVLGVVIYNVAFNK